MVFPKKKGCFWVGATKSDWYDKEYLGYRKFDWSYDVYDGCVYNDGDKREYGVKIQEEDVIYIMLDTV